MRFQDIQSQALDLWNRDYHGTIPTILIGTASCGRAAGSLQVLAAFKQELERKHIAANIIEVGCMGLCSLEPLVSIIKPDSLSICYNNITVPQVPILVDRYVNGDDPCLDLALGTIDGGNGTSVRIPELSRFDHEHRVILAHCGYIDPENIEHAIANGAYSNLEQTLTLTQAAIVNEVTASGLRGRGGAGYPTGLKLESCRKASGTTKYVICNADEGDPGAFMDRVLLESDPHQIIEGMIIAGYAVGAHRGFIYVRSEYSLAVKRLRTALEQAETLGIAGKNIMNTGIEFNIEIAEGAGAFVSGEETALILALEGKRSMPMHRPPFPSEYGLWGAPTLIDNIKTFANITVIFRKGAKWYAGIGTSGSKGTALFSLAGNIVNGGLAEVPMGTTIRRLIFDIGGGMKNGKKCKAVQIGGPSGGCLPLSLFDTPIDFDSLQASGSIMGSGGLIAMDEDNCMVDAAKFFLDFTQKESCGKCPPCRIGTKQLLMMLEDITKGDGTIDDLKLLVELSADIADSSLCNLGRTAANPVLTTLRYFRDEYEAHILEKRCPARVCKDLIAYYILPEKCHRGCDHCVLNCPADAIWTNENGIKVIEQSKCTKCSSCELVCPAEYNAVIRLSPVTLLPTQGERPQQNKETIP